jgi:hypothetical protein
MSQMPQPQVLNAPAATITDQSSGVLRCGFIALSIPDFRSEPLGLSISAGVHSFVFFCGAFGNMI